MNTILQFLILTCLLLLPVQAGSLQSYPHEGIEYSDQMQIKFPQAVHEMQKVREGGEELLRDWELSGPEPLPKLRWVSNNRLGIFYRPGTKVGARYKLSLHKEARFYLNGDEIENAEFELTAPPCVLYADTGISRSLQGGYAEGAVAVFVRQNIYRYCDLDAKKLHFCFEEEDGTVVPATCSRVRVEEARNRGLSYALHRVSTKVLRNYTPQTELPGILKVQPTRPLRGMSTLRLREEVPNVKFGGVKVEFDTELKAELHLGLARVKGESRICLGLLFSAPLKDADVQELFRRMSIRCGGVQAVNTDSGDTKELRLGKETVRFTLNMKKAAPAVGEEFPVDYPQALSDRMLIEVEGLAELPQALSVSLPAGIRAAYGLETKQALTLQAKIEPLCPALSDGGGIHTTPMRMTPSGSHELQLRSIGCTGLRVRAARLSAEQYVDFRDVLRRAYNSSGDEEWAALSYGPEHLYPIAGPIGIQDQISTVCLDDLVEGTLRPGMYILQVQPEMPEELRADADELSPCAYYAVHVTDLHAVGSEGMLYATHLSNGQPVQSGTVRLFNSKETLHTTTLNRGVAVCLLPECRFTLDFQALLQCGDDYTLVTMPGFEVNKPAKRDALCLMTDRSIYSTGDVLHGFGTYRCMDAQGKPALAPEARVRVQALLHDLPFAEMEVPTDSHGAFRFDLQLPKTQEDAEIELKLSCNTATAWEIIPLSCFRRNSFALEQRVELNPVRPQQVTVHLQAKNYHGTPLSAQTANLCINGVLHELPLDAEGKASYTHTFAPWPQEGENVLAKLSINSYVANEHMEYVSNSYQTELYAADFCIRLDKRRLHLYRSGTEEPLQRPQELRLTLEGSVYMPETLPNGLVVYSKQSITVHESSITVPANCREGVRIDEEALVREFERTHPQYRGKLQKAQLRISGTDPAGNTNTYTNHWYSYHQDAHNAGKPMEATVEEGCLSFNVSPQVAGTAFVVIQGAEEHVRSLTLPLNAGRQQVRIPLQAQEHGCRLHATLMLLQQQATGEHTAVEFYTYRAEAPTADTRLHVQLEPQGQPIAPGAEVCLRGKVLQADGTPAAGALLCVYAVDAGMQSLLTYTLPDWGAKLTRVMQAMRHYMPPCMNFYTAGYRADFMDCEPGRCFMNHRHADYLHFLRNTRFYHSAAGMDTPDDDSEVDIDLSDDSELDLDLSGTLHEMSLRYPTLLPEQLWMEGYAVDLGDGLGIGLGGGGDWLDGGIFYTPKIRQNFTPTPIWQTQVLTDADGCFSTTGKVADTLTTYRVYAVAIGENGRAFGSAEGALQVEQGLMLSMGTPFFLRVGDCVQIPVTLTNNTGTDGTWAVRLQGLEQTQQVQLRHGESATTHLTYSATQVGTCTLTAIATGPGGEDAVSNRVEVRPVLPTISTTYFAELVPGAKPLRLVDLLSEESKKLTNVTAEVQVESTPLACLKGLVDYTLTYPYGCTEQTSSTLMPWLLAKELRELGTPINEKNKYERSNIIRKAISKLFSRQREDGGLSYWDDGKESCYWASAHAAMVLTVAQEHDCEVSAQEMGRLIAYLRRGLAEHRATENATTLYSLAYVLKDDELKQEALRQATADTGAHAILHLMAELHTHADVYPRLQQLANETTAGTMSTCWFFMLLHELSKNAPATAGAVGTVLLSDGSELAANAAPRLLSPAKGTATADWEETLRCKDAATYVSVRIKGTLPYEAVPSTGLTLQRRYEVQNATGKWTPATSFRTGDLVRITLTCSGAAIATSYLAVEDYLPSTLEAINPRLSSQAAGLPDEAAEISPAFTHREYLSDRVRAFTGRRRHSEKKLSFTYYARAKRTGTATAPPATAQLMYQPDIYTLTQPNTITTQDSQPNRHTKPEKHLQGQE